MKTNITTRIVVIMLLLATALSFLDRQILSISIIRIKEELNISSIGYGFINTGFLISYAIMFTLGGILIDKYGSRLGMAVSVGFWSFASALHGLATNSFHFGFFRFLLGAGEGGCFPGAVKAVMEWVPKKKQALANGIAIGGSAVGAVIAPPMCAYLLNSVGWRNIFVLSGLFGLVWLLVWMVITMKRDKHKLTDITESLSPESSSANRPGLIKLLKTKEVKIFIFIRFILDPIFYFYMFWIPKYLNEIQNFTIDQIGNRLWIPFLALGIANMLGGWISDRIYSHTASLNIARKTVMGIAALLTIPVILIGMIHSSIIIMAIMSLAFFAHGLWITNYITSISDIFGKSVTSTIVGFSGSAGAISSLVLNPAIGYIIVNFAYDPMWWYAGVMYPLAFIVLLIGIPKIQLKH